MYVIHDEIDQYADRHSKKLSPLLEDLIQETKKSTKYPNMLSSHTSGQFLKILVKIKQPKCVVEVGMFTGFGTLCMVEGLPVDGKIITCEISEEYAAIAKKYFKLHPDVDKIEVRMGPAIESLAKIKHPIDFAFIDADKLNYVNYYETIMEKLSPDGVIVVDNALWGGSVLNPIDDDARTIDRLNKIIRDDSRVDHTLLTVKDGMHLVFKK